MLFFIRGPPDTVVWILPYLKLVSSIVIYSLFPNEKVKINERRKYPIKMIILRVKNSLSQVKVPDEHQPRMRLHS